MPSFSAGAVKRSLSKKGFVISEGANHTRCDYIYEGRRITTTVMSRNNQEINDYLQSAMGKQLYMTKKQFCELVACTLSHDAYVDILKLVGRIK